MSNTGIKIDTTKELAPENVSWFFEPMLIADFWHKICVIIIIF